MKKLITILLAGAMAVGMTACGGGSSSSSSTPAESGASESASESASAEASTEPAAEGTGADVHVASWNNAADNLNEIAEAFNAQEGHSGKVIVDYVDSDYSKLRPALAAGTGVPDIFQTQNRDIPAFFNNYGLQAFADLTDIIEPDADKWVAFALETCKAEDGKYYAIPWDIGPVGLFYRTDIYAEAGIDPTTLTTWDKYMEAGKTLKALNADYYIEAYNFNGATSRDQLMIYLNQQGGQYYDADGKVNLGSPEYIKSIELSQKMIADGLAMDIPNAWDDRIAAINENKLVSLPYAAWYMGTMKNSCADLSGKWGIAPAPGFEEGKNTANAGGSILAVSSTTGNLELAKQFLVYSMKDDAGNDINTKYGEFPSYKPAYETEFFKSTDEYFSGQAVGSIFASLTGAPATTWGPYFLDVDESTKTMAGNIYTAGMSAEEATAIATKDAQSKIDIK